MNLNLFYQYNLLDIIGAGCLCLLTLVIAIVLISIVIDIFRR